MADEAPVPDGFDLGETFRVLDEAEVVVIGFGWFGERLLVDGRRSETAGPFVRVVAPVRTAQERIGQLREWRPDFNDPESFVFIPWAGRVETFVQTGLFDRVLHRCSGDAKAESDCRQALNQLLALDRDDLQQAILGGEKYHTLYDRGGPNESV